MQNIDNPSSSSSLGSSVVNERPNHSDSILDESSSTRSRRQVFTSHTPPTSVSVLRTSGRRTQLQRKDDTVGIVDRNRAEGVPGVMMYDPDVPDACAVGKEKVGDDSTHVDLENKKT